MITTRQALGLAATSLAAAAALVLSGCSPDPATTDPTTTDTTTTTTSEATPTDTGDAVDPIAVTVLQASPQGMGWAVELIAQENNLFNEAGLEVTLESSEGGTATVQQLIAKQVDFVYSDASSIVVAATKDATLRVLGCQNQSNVFSINVPADSDIQDISGFAGKKLGIVDQGSGEGPLVKAALAEAGIADQVELVAIGAGPAAVRAIQQDQVQGYASGLSDLVPVKAAGIEVRNITPDNYAGLQSHCLTTRADVLADAQGKDTATRLMTALIRGADSLLADQEGAYEVVCTTTPQSCQNEDAARAYLDSIVTITTPADQEPNWSINQDGWQATVDFLAVARSVDASTVDLTALTQDTAITEVFTAASFG
jgi:NitT/TauT family transport system substrate-binding protein